MQNKLIIFQESSHLIGINPSDFDSAIQLNAVWISPSATSENVWEFESKDAAWKGCFVHPGTLFGFGKVYFDASSYLFLQKENDDFYIGILMNEFLIQLSEKRTLSKKLEIDLVKNFPAELPKSAFQFVHRYKRKNVLVLHPAGLLETYHIKLPSIAS